MKHRYEKDPKGHEWIKESDGSVDIFAYQAGKYCNGPRCKKCGYGFCHHCSNDKAKHPCEVLP